MAIELMEIPDEFLPSPSSPSFTEIKPSSPMGAGLVNLGNTCFLNAVLQCVTHTVPLVQGLRSCDHASPCNRHNGGFCVLCGLRDHIQMSLSSAGGIVSPLNLVENLSYISPSFRRFDQEDAHEFLHCLLDRLHSCCSDLKSQEKSLSSQDESFVEQVFGGRLRSQLRCCQCGHCSDTFEPLLDLSLEIEDVDSLSTALKSFTSIEKIEDPEFKFTCESCKAQVAVEKQLTLDRVPTVASFHLKRFKSDGSCIEKIEKFVEYPLELDLQTFLSSPNGNNETLRYELYAVVVHDGLSSSFGHYYCFIRSSPDTWHRLDDSKVTRISKETVLSQEAYILFYMREGTPWFSSLMETQKKNSIIFSTSPKSVLEDADRLNVTSILGASTSSSSGSEADGATEAKDIVCPRTPSPARSPSPEFEEPSGLKILPPEPSGAKQMAEAHCQIPRIHMKSEVRESAKPANILNDDLTRGSLSKLTRSMPSSRRSQLLACVPLDRWCLSEDSTNKNKKRRMVSSFQRDLSLAFNGRDARPPANGAASFQSLSPCSIRQGLAAGASHSLPQFDYR